MLHQGIFIKATQKLLQQLIQIYPQIPQNIKEEHPKHSSKFLFPWNFRTSTSSIHFHLAGQPRARRRLPSSLADVLAPLADVLAAGVAVAQRGLVAGHRHRPATREGTAGGPTRANCGAAGTGGAGETGGVWDEFRVFFHFWAGLVHLPFLKEKR